MAVLALVVAAFVLTYPNRWPGTGVAGAAGSPRTSSSPPAPTTGPNPRHTPPSPSASANPIRVLGLGDSVTYGSNCDCRDFIAGFGTLLRHQDDMPVRTDNEGEPGATTADLSDELSRDAKLRSAVTRADIIVVTIGANDLNDSLHRWRSGGCGVSCYQPGVEAMTDRLTTLLGKIHQLHTGGAPQVLVTDYWNVFADGQVAGKAESAGYPAWSDRVTRAANVGICKSATRTASTCVDLYLAFKPHPGSDPTDLLADDGDHPNAAGTALISRTVLSALDSSGPH